jgi:hypothetical protein
MNEFVPIYVPVVHQREMLSHLVSLMSRAPAHADTQAGETTQDQHEWPEDVWRRVWPVVTDDTRKIFVILARHADEWVPIDALEQSLGTFNAVQGTLSSLTKRLKKQGLANWPFVVEDDHENTGRAAYTMTAETATIVLKLDRGA